MRHALEAFIKRRFFVVHLLLLAIAAILVARTVTAVAGHFVAEKIKEKAGLEKTAATRPPPPHPSATRDFNAASEANIFEGKREVVAEGVAPVDTGPPPDAESCDGAQKSTSRLRLVGTVVFSTPEYSVASIVDESKSGALAEMYSINDCVDPQAAADDPNSKLAAKPPPCSHIGESSLLRRIEPERICVWNETEHHMEYLAISEPPDKGPVAPKVAMNTEAPAATDDIGKDIKKTGENSYEVGQGEVDKALNNLAELSTQARIVPAFEGGKTVGFKLFSIRPGSLYSKIGLQNGDVITRINGYEMSSPEKGLEIYTKLKDSKSVTVDMKRRGKPMTLDYNITQ